MEFRDYSPPETPTPAEQRDALRKGLGRAVQWARRGGLHQDVILHACLHDQRYDMQFEEYRGEWLWEIAKLTGAVEPLRQALPEALRNVTTEGDGCQLCILAACFAKVGDDDFRDALDEFVSERRIADAPWVGEDELLLVCGEDGLLRIAHLRGAELEGREWTRDDSSVVDRAAELLGEDRVIAQLKSSPDPAIQRFTREWNAAKSRPATSNVLDDAWLDNATVAEVVAFARRDEHGIGLRRWGTQATDPDLAVVLEAIWDVQEPRVLANLLQVFWKRPLPSFDSRLFEVCRHSDARVRKQAINALENNSHPEVREFALRELRERRLDESVLGLFVKNSQPHDEELILGLLELPDDDFFRHGMLIDLKQLLVNHPEAECEKLGLIGYVHTPCSFCRFAFAELLVERKTAPAWLIEECRDDCSEECREFFQRVES